ncbi:MAG: hypothetical protein IKT54_06005 [Clostridia bacterium]|nr:hypothetical protein [Clostridia bacterium]
MTCRLLDFYGGLLSDRQREILSLHYDEDLSLGEISHICGITRQGVADALKKGENALNDFEARLGLLSRADALEKNLAEIAKQLDEGKDRKEIAEILRSTVL